MRLLIMRTIGAILTGMILLAQPAHAVILAGDATVNSIGHSSVAIIALMTRRVRALRNGMLDFSRIAPSAEFCNERRS